MSEQGFKGRWRISSMEQWDKALIDSMEPAFIEFLDHDFGSFHFGSVYANLDYRLDGQGKAEFSFCGDEEGQEVFGRGWVQKNDQGLHGTLFFHEGEQSTFKGLKESSSIQPKIVFKGRTKRMLRKERSKLELF